MSAKIRQATTGLPARKTVAHMGFWSAATEGTFSGFVTVTSQAFNPQGTATVTVADLESNL